MTWKRLGTALVGLLVVAGCSSSDGAGIEVSDAWGRTSPSAARNAAFYMTLTNNGNEADQLVGASTGVCGVIELHESMMSDDGVMMMAPVEGEVIEVPAGGEVELKVGGLHVMCIDRQGEFAAGDTIDLTLEFANAGSIDIEVEIREG